MKLRMFLLVSSWGSHSGRGLGPPPPPPPPPPTKLPPPPPQFSSIHRNGSPTSQGSFAQQYSPSLFVPVESRYPMGSPRTYEYRFQLCGFAGSLGDVAVALYGSGD